MVKKILYIDLDNTLVDFKSRLDALDEDLMKRYEGKWIKFGSDEFPDWTTVTNHLLSLA